MEFEFTCECGRTVSDLVRNNGEETSFQVPCEDCGAIYAVTVTQIRKGGRG